MREVRVVRKNADDRLRDLERKVAEGNATDADLDLLHRERQRRGVGDLSAFTSLVRKWADGSFKDEDLGKRLASMLRRDRPEIPSERRALSELEFYVVEDLLRTGTREGTTWEIEGLLGFDPSYQTFQTMAATKQKLRTWLARCTRRFGKGYPTGPRAGTGAQWEQNFQSAQKRSRTLHAWVRAAIEASDPAASWPAVLFEPGGYGLDDLRPREEDSYHSEYVEPIVIYVRGNALTDGRRFTGPFYPRGGGRRERGEHPNDAVIEDSYFQPNDALDQVDDGLISSAGLQDMAVEEGFGSVEEWVRHGIEDGDVIQRAHFAASIWFSIAGYSGLDQDDGYSWDEFRKRCDLEIAMEDAGWLR